MEHTKRANRRPALWLTAALVFGLLMSLLAVPAHAAESYEAAAGVWQTRDGDDRTTYAAVVVELADTIYLFAPDMSDYTDTVYGAITVDDSWKAISYYGREADEMSLWTFDEEPGVTPLSFGAPVQGEECWLVYSESTVETGAMRVTVTGIVDEDESLISVSGMPGESEINYPAAVVNSDNQVVAVAASPDYIWGPGVDSDTFYAGGSGGSGDTDTDRDTDTDADTPASSRSSSPASGSGSSGSGSSGGGSAMPLIVVVGVIVAVAAVAVLSKKKKAPTAGAGSVQPPVNVPDTTNSTGPIYQSAKPAAAVEDIGKTLPVNTDEQTRVTEQVEAAAGQLWLVVTGGYMLGRVYPIDQNEMVIGRSPTATIPYQDETVSKVHCKLYWENGVLMLMDCNSANGTYLQRIGKLSPMQPVALQPDDVFCIGSTKNEFQIRT